MIKFFCSSDIHSFFDEWMLALTNAGFDFDNAEHKIIVCGDLFDRGPQTIECLEFMKEMLSKGRAIYIRGNHEDLLFDCLNEIKCGRIPSSHHFHNKTVKTICDICEQSEYILYDPTWRDKIVDKLEDLLSLITNNCVDYAEIGNSIFVHGWLPCYEGLEDYKSASMKDWSEARWDNGMQMWKNPNCRIPGKRIVCGHYHCSWGWSHLDQTRKEFPQLNQKGWQKSFEPYIKEGIAAIDACTAYTHIVNVLVFDEEGNIV